MSHDVKVTPVTRRNFGIPREVQIVRCSCGYRCETHDLNIANRLKRNHQLEHLEGAQA